MSTQRPPASPDDAIRGAWREASEDQPPTQIDAAILAAARAAVADDTGLGAASVPRARTGHWFTRWQPLAAAAAVAGLALVIAHTLPRDHVVTPPPSVPSRAPAPSAPPGPAAEKSVSTPSAREVVAESPAMADQAALAGRSEADQVAAEVAADYATAPAAKTPANLAPPAARSSAEADAGPVAPGAEMRMMEASPGLAARIDRIIALHGAGDEAGAAAELRALRAADPDADLRLPDTLREWAKTVR